MSRCECSKIYLQDLMHKMRVMDKAGKQQLRNEIARHKNVKKLLEVAEEEIQRLKDVIEVKQKANIS